MERCFGGGRGERPFPLKKELKGPHPGKPAVSLPGLGRPRPGSRNLFPAATAERWDTWLPRIHPVLLGAPAPEWPSPVPRCGHAMCPRLCRSGQQVERAGLPRSPGPTGAGAQPQAADSGTPRRRLPPRLPERPESVSPALPLPGRQQADRGVLRPLPTPHPSPGRPAPRAPPPGRGPHICLPCTPAAKTVLNMLPHVHSRRGLGRGWGPERLTWPRQPHPGPPPPCTLLASLSPALLPVTAPGGSALPTGPARQVRGRTGTRAPCQQPALAVPAESSRAGGSDPPSGRIPKCPFRGDPE